MKLSLRYVCANAFLRRGLLDLAFRSSFMIGLLSSRLSGIFSFTRHEWSFEYDKTATKSSNFPLCFCDFFFRVSRNNKRGPQTSFMVDRLCSLMSVPFRPIPSAKSVSTRRATPHTYKHRKPTQPNPNHHHFPLRGATPNPPKWILTRK